MAQSSLKPWALRKRRLGFLPRRRQRRPLIDLDTAMIDRE